MANKQINDLPVGVSIDPEADSVPFWDAGAGVTRRISPSDMFAGSFAEINHTHSLDQISATYATALDKVAPIDADTVPLADSTAGNVLRKLSWANLKATLKTYFDTLYNLYVHPNHAGDVTSAADGATTIVGNAVTNAKAADMAQNTVKGRITASTGDPEDLTATQVRTVLNVASGADATGSTITALAAKTTPVDADAVVITDSAASGAPKRTLWSNIKATLKTYFDTLYVALTGDQTVAGVKTWANNAIFNANIGIGAISSGSKLTIQTSNAKGANITENAIVLHSNNVSSQFQLIAGLGLTTLVASEYAYLQSVEQGVAFRPVILNPSGGNVGIGTTSPQGILHAHDGTGGFLSIAKTGVAGTAITVVPDGTGDCLYRLQCQYVVRASDGTVTSGASNVNNNSSNILYSAGSTLILGVNANGSIYVQRTSGSLTFTVALDMVWL